MGLVLSLAANRAGKVGRPDRVARAARAPACALAHPALSRRRRLAALATASVAAKILRWIRDMRLQAGLAVVASTRAEEGGAHWGADPHARRIPRQSVAVSREG